MTSLPLSIPLLLIVALGPAITFDIGGLSYVAVALWMLTAVAALSIAVKIRRVDAGTLWVWIVLGLFAIGYFAKTFSAAAHYASEGSLSGMNPEWSEFSDADLLAGYEVTGLAFLAFVGGLPFWKFVGAPTQAVRHRPERVRASLIVLSVIVLVLALLRVALGIGVMGVESDEIPFGIDTLVFRAQSSLIPACLLVIMWSGARSGDLRVSNLAIVVLGLHLVAIATVSASKAGLIYFAVYVLFHWIVCNQFTLRRQLILGALCALAVIAFVAGAELRTLRIDGMSLLEAVETLTAEGNLVRSFALDEGLRAIFLRVSGADGIWFVLSDPYWQTASVSERVSGLWHSSIRDIYTREIVGVTWLQDFRAPGFVAAFMLVVGQGGIALCALVGPLTVTLWKIIGRAPGAPALLVFAAVFLLQVLMEGIFQWQDFAAFLITLPFAVTLSLWLEGAPAWEVTRSLLPRRIPG